jgi:hypothetical protein
MQPPAVWRRLMHMELVRYALPHWLAGCIAGLVAAVALVAINLGSLRDLMLQTQGGWLAFVLLMFALAATFGAVAFGHAVMTVGDDPH